MVAVVGVVVGAGQWAGKVVIIEARPQGAAEGAAPSGVTTVLRAGGCRWWSGSGFGTHGEVVRGRTATLPMPASIGVLPRSGVRFDTFNGEVSLPHPGGEDDELPARASAAVPRTVSIGVDPPHPGDWGGGVLDLEPGVLGR